MMMARERAGCRGVGVGVVWDVPFHLVEDLHAAYDAAEDSVLAVQMCRRTV